MASTNINDTLSLSKRQALSSLINLINIPFDDIRQKINGLANNSIGFDSLLTLYSPVFKTLSSDVCNATNLLAYLDFFSLYTILFANETSVKNLIDITNNKISYLNASYRNVDTKIKEKTLQKNNKYAQYTNFLNPDNIDLVAAKSMLSKDRLSNSLNTYPILTLPINYSKSISPISIVCSDSDSSMNIISNTCTNDSINYSVNRLGFNKIGVVDNVTALKEGNIYTGLPVVNGTVQGYYSDLVYLVVSSVDIVGQKVSIIGSSNNLDWSTAVDIPIGVATLFNVDNNVNIGLLITIVAQDGNIPSISDSWKISLRYISVDDPILTSKIKFNSLDQISYLSYNDISRYSPTLTNFKIQYRNLEQYSASGNLQTVISNGIDNLIPTFNSINNIELTLKQNNYFIDQINTNFVHNYNFNINNINGIYNEYDSFGIISFPQVSILNTNPILNIKIDSNEFITNDPRYLVYDNLNLPAPRPAISKQFIEHYIMLTVGSDTLYLSYPQNSSYVNEYIVPSSNVNGIATYETKFPVDSSVSKVVYNVTNSSVVDPSQYTVTQSQTSSNTNIFNIQNFNLKNVYIISYKIKINSYTDVLNFNINESINVGKQWMYNKATAATSNIFYSYYLDLDGVIRIAVATLDTSITNGIVLSPFYGKVASLIQMRSLDKAFVSPMIFEHSLLCN